LAEHWDLLNTGIFYSKDVASVCSVSLDKFYVHFVTMMRVPVPVYVLTKKFCTFETIAQEAQIMRNIFFAFTIPVYKKYYTMCIMHGGSVQFTFVQYCITEAFQLFENYILVKNFYSTGTWLAIPNV
jgi:hypothetical protein